MDGSVTPQSFSEKQTENKVSQFIEKEKKKYIYIYMYIYFYLYILYFIYIHSNILI